MILLESIKLFEALDCMQSHMQDSVT